MPWRQPEIDPEKIIGMKPDELKIKLESAVTKDDLKNAVAPIEEFKGQLAAITDSLKKLTTPKEPEVTPDPDADNPVVKMLTDPAAFVASVTKPEREAGLRTQAQLGEMRARSTYSGVFNQYNDDLLKNAAKFSLEQQAQPGFWDWQIRLLLGDKAINGKIEPNKFPSLLTSSNVGPRGDSAEPGSTLSPEMAAWLKGRGVPLEKAEKIRNLMIRDGEPITHANYFGSAKAN